MKHRAFNTVNYFSEEFENRINSKTYFDPLFDTNYRLKDSSRL